MQLQQQNALNPSKTPAEHALSSNKTKLIVNNREKSHEK